MQRLAHYALDLLAGGDSGFEETIGVVEDWLALRRANGGSPPEWSVGERREHRRVRWTIGQPHERGFECKSVVTVSQAERDVGLTFDFSQDGPPFRTSPVKVYRPRLIEDLVRDPLRWTCAGTLVRREPEPFKGRQAGRRLSKILFDGRRVFPVVVFSEASGGFLDHDLDRVVASDLLALARVVRIDTAAGWGIVGERDGRLSCFGGSVRLFWPNATAGDSPSDHPHWNSSVPRKRLRRELRELIFPTSCVIANRSAADDAVREVLRAERQEKRRAALRRERTQGVEEGRGETDEELLEAAVSAEGRANAAEELVEQLKTEIFGLEQQIVGLLRKQGNARGFADVPLSAPTSVLEAVRRAREQSSGDLLFGKDVERGAAELDPGAWPPEKILKYLSVLADLSRRRSTGGPLGKKTIPWLAERLGGSETVSSESESGKNDPQLARKTTFHDGKTRRRFFYHLKVSDGTNPSRCVRVYFDPNTSPVIVGWVGRHP